MIKSVRKSDRERLLRIISMCLSVEKGDTDPFEVEVKKVLSVLKKYLSHWKAFEEM